MTRLHAYEEGVAIRGYRAAALVGAGRVAEARGEIEEILGDTGGFVQSPIPVNRAEGSQRLAVVHAALAEATLAEGEIECGLAEYRNALTVLGWPDAEGLNPGPGESMLVSACVDAHVLHDRAADVDDMVGRVSALALEFLGRYRDLPQIGAIGTAVGSYLIASGTDSDRGLRMLALARNARGRQDLRRWPSTVTSSMPAQFSVRPGRHRARHRPRHAPRPCGAGTARPPALPVVALRLPGRRVVDTEVQSSHLVPTTAGR